MKIQEQDFYHGVVLKQIADHPTFTSINKISTKDGVYQINDNLRILIKYSTTDDSEWKFTFRENDLNELNNDLYTDKYCFILVCGGHTVCLLNRNDISELINLENNSTQWVSVTYPDGGQMRVSGSQGDLSRLVPHNSFPRDMFDIVTKDNEEYAWPPLSKITFYSEEPPKYITHDKNRMLDLTDSLMRSCDERTAYFGLSSISHLWETWSEENLEEIESLIKYDLEFDGFTVEVERITDSICQYTKKQDIPCTKEFIWKLDIFPQDDELEEDLEGDAAIDLNNHEKPEVRNSSPTFPSLVRPKKQEICSIEIDIDSLQQKEEFKFGQWSDLIAKLTAVWVEKNNFSDRGTVWAASYPSTNFGHQSYSMFLAILGMPDDFQSFITNELSDKFGQYARTYSDYVIPSENNGWNPRYHIQEGKVWKSSDPVTWKECMA